MLLTEDINDAVQIKQVGPMLATARAATGHGSFTLFCQVVPI